MPTYEIIYREWKELNNVFIQELNNKSFVIVEAEIVILGAFLT